MGCRLIRDRFTGSFTMSLEPSRYTAQLVSGFLHNDIALWPGHLHLFLGTKLEHNSYTGLERQPNARLWWSPTASHIFWVAASQTARIPSRSEFHFRGITQIMPPDSLFPGAPVALVTLYGDRRFEAEQMRGLELGYRTLQGDLLVDLTAFYNRYTQVRTNEPGLPFLEDFPSPSHLRVPVRVANKGNGRTWGWEGTADWQRSRRWNLRAAYSYLRMRLQVTDDSMDRFTESYDGEIPRHQFSLRFHLALASRLALDATGRFVDRLPTRGIDRYLTLDTRLGWHLDDHLELALVGRDLLDRPRREYVSSTVPSPPALIEASFYGMATWKR
jgi:iron complex outermembrane receptor protein